MENSCIRRGRHCVFALHAHLVFVTKYRGRCFTTKHLAILQKSFTEVCNLDNKKNAAYIPVLNDGALRRYW